MSPESQLGCKKTWKRNSSPVQLHLYFNFQLLISTGSRGPKAGIFVLCVFQMMDERNVASESSQPVFTKGCNRCSNLPCLPWGEQGEVHRRRMSAEVWPLEEAPTCPEHGGGRG